MNARQRPTLIQATQPTGLRPATAFTAGLALPNGYTYVLRDCSDILFSIVCLCRRIYPEQLAALGGLTAYPLAPQPQPSIRYITTAAAPHGQPPGAYTIGYDCQNNFVFQLN